MKPAHISRTSFHFSRLAQLGESAAPEITIVGLPTLPEVKREITFDVFSGSSQFDGYIMTPLWIGELAEGLYETTQFLKDYGANVDPTYWTDILLSYREVIARYDNKLYLFPFDGDVFSVSFGSSGCVLLLLILRAMHPPLNATPCCFGSVFVFLCRCFTGGICWRSITSASPRRGMSVSSARSLLPIFHISTLLQ